MRGRCDGFGVGAVLRRGVVQAADLLGGADLAATVVDEDRQDARITRAAELRPSFLPFGEHGQILLGDDLFEMGLEVAARFPADGNRGERALIRVAAGDHVGITAGRQLLVGDVVFGSAASG